MKTFCAFIFFFALAGISTSIAQQVYDSKKDRAVLSGYLDAVTRRSDPYFYGLYVANHFRILYPSDSATIDRFLSTPNEWSDKRSILVSRIQDLDRLSNLQDTVLVYGPRSMAPYVRGYVPPLQPLRVAYKKLSLFKWLGATFVNSIGFSPSRVAYGRWFTPYSIRSFESNPNALPYYMTYTNTNKYLSPSTNNFIRLSER